MTEMLKKHERTGRKARARIVTLALATSMLAACAHAPASQPGAASASMSDVGRHQVSTLPLPQGVIVRSGTYTPSGKVLVSYASNEAQDRRQVSLATVDDDGRNFRPFFSQALPVRPKDNGIRFMIFPDNRRIFMGDFILECATDLESCTNPALLPVTYPKEVADGPHVMHRWSEMIVAHDNRHVAWTTLFSNLTAAVFTGELQRSGAGYVIANPRIVSTLDPFMPDPRHPDGVIPQPIRGGEVKQFVHGGTAISMAGAVERDIPDSVVQHLATGRVEPITVTPGYTETTIFSPDERLGVVMTTRFSQSDPAILGLVPRPYPASLNMGLNWAAYTYSVIGVRRGRAGNIGPALIEIEKSKRQGVDYRGINLNTDNDWVFNSPMSWHPNGKSALWPETRRGGGGSRRLQILRLPDYQPGPTIPTQPTPETMTYAISDMSALMDYAAKPQDIDVKVYGRHSGHITYRRTPAGMIQKTYVNFSDDGQSVYSGHESMQVNPRGNSTYTADVRLTGPKPGVMNLRVTFGSLEGEPPAQLIFTPDASGRPLTYGYAEYGGKRLEASSLVP